MGEYINNNFIRQKYKYSTVWISRTPFGLIINGQVHTTNEILERKFNKIRKRNLEQFVHQLWSLSTVKVPCRENATTNRETISLIVAVKSVNSIAFLYSNKVLWWGRCDDEDYDWIDRIYAGAKQKLHANFRKQPTEYPECWLLQQPVIINGNLFNCKNSFQLLESDFAKA